MSLSGLYAIADTATIGDARFEAAAGAALAGGARLIQYRDKRRDGERRAHQARTLVELAEGAGAYAIVNDDIALAEQVGADGVHVGGDDADPGDARRRLGPNALVGVSCYAEMERARRARAAGADYAAFGRVWPSATKASTVRAPLELLGRARAETGLAICAIGGITLERAPQVIAAGADLIAVIEDLFTAADVRARASALAACFPSG